MLKFSNVSEQKLTCLHFRFNCLLLQVFEQLQSFSTTWFGVKNPQHHCMLYESSRSYFREPAHLEACFLCSKYLWSGTSLAFAKFLRLGFTPVLCCKHHWIQIPAVTAKSHNYQVTYWCDFSTINIFEYIYFLTTKLNKVFYICLQVIFNFTSINALWLGKHGSRRLTAIQPRRQVNNQSCDWHSLLLSI